MFLNPSIQLSQVMCMCCSDYANIYRYQGLVLDAFVYDGNMAKTVTISGGRALGPLIAKSKNMGDMNFNVFRKLYGNLVLPIITYEAFVWGSKIYCCIGAVQNRACRLFLGVGKHTPTDTVLGDICWMPVFLSQKKAVLEQWYRLTKMNKYRLNKKVFNWAEKCSVRYKMWIFNVYIMFKECNYDHIYNTDALYTNIVNLLMNIIVTKYVSDWSLRIREQTGKLRTYKHFKYDYFTEFYVSTLLEVRFQNVDVVLLL